MPLVSVILPTYNRAGTIMRAAYSVLGQSVADIELIVVDDCSTDDTLARLAEVTDPRLRVVSPVTRMGAGAARNFGLKFARSEILAFQDSDDVWLVDKLERQLPLIEDPDVVLVCGGYLVKSKNGIYTYQASDEWMLDGRWSTSDLYQFKYVTPTWLIRKKTFVEFGGFDCAMKNLEDWEFALRLFDIGRLRVINEPLILKCGGEDSLNFDRDSRIQSLSYMLDKHQSLLSGARQVKAALHSELGSAQVYSGDIVSGRSNFRAALALEPDRFKHFLKYIMSFGGAAFYRVIGTHLGRRRVG